MLNTFATDQPCESEPDQRDQLTHLELSTPVITIVTLCDSKDYGANAQSSA